MTFLSAAAYFCGGLLLVLLLLFVAFRLAIVWGGRGVRPVDPPALVRRPAEEAVVERLANDDLRVTWEAQAEQVSVYAGHAPNRIDWGRPLVVVRGGREALVAGLDPRQRFYFGLRFDLSLIHI